MTRQTLECIIKFYQRRGQRLQSRLQAEQDSTEAFRLRRAIRRNQSKLAPIEEFFSRNDAEPDGKWVTMNGTHVLIENGTVSGGPTNLKGKQYKPKAGSSSTGGGSSEVRGATGITPPKKEHHVAVSEEDRKKISKYTKRMQEEGEAVINQKEEIDEMVKSAFGETTMTTSEFAERSMAAVDSWSEEDRMLDAAYTGSVAGIGSKLGVGYSEINRKLREGEHLTDNEQAVVDHFARCAEPLGKDTDLYRMVGKDYVESILASTGASDIQGLVGQTVTNDALQSTCAGVNSFFMKSDIAIKIKASADAKVCFTSDVGEGEIVIPTGAKMRIVSVNTQRPATIRDMHTERDPRTSLPVWNTVRGAYGGGVSTNAYNCGFKESKNSRQDPTGLCSVRAKTYIEMELLA